MQTSKQDQFSRHILKGQVRCYYSGDEDPPGDYKMSVRRGCVSFGEIGLQLGSQQLANQEAEEGAGIV